jgi:hypothetical protein
VSHTFFIQPTYQCALNCKGCYVKESLQNTEVSSEILDSLIRYLWVTEKFNVGQVTLAVDDVPDDAVVAAKMISALKTALQIQQVTSGVEFHITINSLRTLQKYIDSGLPLEYIASHSDLISISYLSPADIPLLKLIRNYTKVNYNYMHSKNLHLFREMLDHVDMSYYLLYKTGLAKQNDFGAIDVFKQGLREIGSWNPSEKAKVKVDGCVQDARKFLKTGFGCSSNVSRFHIWPDGHVTGCAYNKDGGIPASTLTGIVQNISVAAREYEFKRCTIPGDYSGRSSLRIIQG